MKIKAHITLKPEKMIAPDGKNAALARIQARAPITEFNQKRFERYGIISGLIDDSLLEQIRAIPDVLSVEIDKERTLR